MKQEIKERVEKIRKGEVPEGYKETKVGIIPEEWDVSFTDDVAKRGTGHTPNKKFPSYYNGGIKWISLQDSNKLDNGLIFHTKVEISEEGLSNSSAVLHSKGSVLISRDAGIGKSAIMGNEMAVSQHFITWTCSNKLNNWYLYYYLQKKKREFERIAVGSTIKTIGMPFFKKYKIPLPPIKEQEKIVVILSTWDKAIGLKEKLIEEKKKFKKGLIQKLLTGETRFLEFTDEWKEMKLEDMFDITTATSKSTFIEKNGKYFIVDMGAISSEAKLITKKTTNCTKDFLEKGNLVMPKDDIGGGNIIGKVVFIPQNFKYILGDHVYKLSIKKGCFLFYYFLINAFPINKNLRRKANGTAQLGLSKKDVKKQKLVYPNDAEQRKIADFLNSIDNNIDLLNKELNQLKEQKRGLMQLLLTGIVRVEVD